MEQPGYGGESFRTRRELEKTQDFEDAIHENPGALKSFLKLMKELEDSVKGGEEIESAEDEILKITPIPDERLGKRYIPISPLAYLKVEMGDQSYFVKTIPGNFKEPRKSFGADEFRDLKKVSEILKDIPGVKTLDFQVGYQDKANNKTYFVTKWVDLPKAYECYEKNPELEKRVTEIREILKQNKIVDLNKKNIFYDENTDTIYVFDVFELDRQPAETVTAQNI